MNSSDGISHESEGGHPIDELATFENVINNQEINFKKNPGIDKDEGLLRLFWPSFRRPSHLWRAESLFSPLVPLFDFLIYSAWNNNNRRDTQRRQTIKESNVEKSAPHIILISLLASIRSAGGCARKPSSGNKVFLAAFRSSSALSRTSLYRHRRPTTRISLIYLYM